MEAYGYRFADHGVAWDAEVTRADWTALGVKALPVTSTIWVYHGKLANFTMVSRNDMRRSCWACCGARSPRNNAGGHE